MRFLSEVRYVFDGKGVQPNLVGGVGYDIYDRFTSVASESLNDLDFLLGGGVMFDLGYKLKIFIEAKCNSASLSYLGASASGYSNGASTPNLGSTDAPLTADLTIWLN